MTEEPPAETRMCGYCFRKGEAAKLTGNILSACGYEWWHYTCRWCRAVTTRRRTRYAKERDASTTP